VSKLSLINVKRHLKTDSIKKYSYFYIFKMYYNSNRCDEKEEKGVSLINELGIMQEKLNNHKCIFIV
jgi:hypothetical protein